MTGDPYAYVSENPLNMSDPSGMCVWIGCDVVHIWNTVRNGGLPNGHCIVGLQNNCQADFGVNLHKVAGAVGNEGSACGFGSIPAAKFATRLAGPLALCSAVAGALVTADDINQGKGLDSVWDGLSTVVGAKWWKSAAVSVATACSDVAHRAFNWLSDQPRHTSRWDASDHPGVGMGAP
jgi:hypothetical protein